MQTKTMRLIGIVFLLIAAVFFYLWITMPETLADDEDTFEIIGDSLDATPTPEETPAPKPTSTTPILATPVPTIPPTPAPEVLIDKLIKYCRKSLDSSRCVLEVALALKDSSICEETIMKEQCYYWLSLNLGDSSLCDKSDAPLRCQAVTLKKPELCEDSVVDLEGFEKQELAGLCYSGVAVALGNGELCEKADLVDSCYQSVALVSADESLCGKGTDKWECKAIIGLDSALCEKAYTPSSCYGELSLILNDVDLAEKAGMDKDYFYEIAKNISDIELCSKSLDPVKCEAVISRDEEKCNDASNRKACFGDLAVALAEDEAAKTE